MAGGAQNVPRGADDQACKGPIPAEGVVQDERTKPSVGYCSSGRATSRSGVEADAGSVGRSSNSRHPPNAWFGRRAREASYLAHLMRILDPANRTALLSMAFEESRKKSADGT